MFDVVHGCSKIPLRNNNNPIRHILWDEAGIGPNDAYDRNVYRRENVCRSANDRQPSHDQDKDCHHYECVGPA